MPVIKCPDCGAFNGTHDETCKKCGASLNPQKLAQAAGGNEQPSKVPWYRKILGRNK